MRQLVSIRVVVVASLATSVALSGCGPSSVGPGGNAEPESLFGTSTIKTRAVVVTSGQRPYPLESLAIHASPLSEVKASLAPILANFDARVAEVNATITSVNDRLSSTEADLANAEAEIIQEYNSRVPDAAREPDLAQRNAISQLSKLRAEKSKADTWYRHAIAERVEPLKATIAAHEQELRSLRSATIRLQQGLGDDVFRGLPSAPTKTWITGRDGEASITVPNDEPWMVWASASRKLPTGQTEVYRWIRRLPDDLDSNGSLFLDQNNLLNVHGLVSRYFDMPFDTPTLRRVDSER